MNTRKTKWSKEDENTLIELVENYERKGKSKQEAFEVVANIINRTKSACATRYHLLRKKEINEVPSTHCVESDIPSFLKKSITLESVIAFLLNYECDNHLFEQNRKLQQTIKNLKEDNETLNNRIIQLKITIEKNHNLLKNLVHS